MNRPLQAALRKLKDSDVGWLSSSKLSPSQKKALDVFGRQTGAVSSKPKGSGVVYTIDAPAVVEQHWRELTPMDAARLLDATPDRARNIALSGSSKVGKHGHDRMYLLLKSAGGESNWRQRHEHALNLYDITRQLGAVAMMISDQPMLDSGWTTDKALWLVENQVLFDNLEWFQGATGDTLVWYRGALPNMLINWFALQPRCTNIHFFPDYDAVGLKDYVRLRKALGDTVNFWFIPGWRDLLRRTGNTKLWGQKKNMAMFKSAKDELEHLDRNQELHMLMQEMQLQGKVLEQEAVYLHNDLQ